MSTILAPKIGRNRVNEMLSPDSSLETKGWAARWYAEMLIELFLSKEAKLEDNKFEDLSLGDKIQRIKNHTSQDVIDALFFIEEVGNKATHFKLNRELALSDVEKAVSKATSLFDLILVDIFKDGGLGLTYNTARLFSTLLPSIRVNVLQELVNLSCLESEYDVMVLHKYLLALTKNGQREKARRLIRKLKKKEVIEEFQFEFWEKSINAIYADLDNLPIPKKIEDCQRNFLSVLASMDDEEKEMNSRFIHLVQVMYDKVAPSEMGSLVEDKLLLI
ncbi:hypothetical protein GL270_10770 [Aeromonas veronii]|uniref:hypothetical protein n=1 Tax=Aeromonas veronii TaxID=654 RepID=UPI00111B8F45|nr:hypothetical protein [Aeromonas veronii]MBW3781724.1 hypothetical protein [Aeromonas veronii]